MKRTIMKILKSLAVFTPILLIAGLSAALIYPDQIKRLGVHIPGLDWRLGVSILIGLFVLWLVWMFVGKLWQKRKEQKFVQQVIEQEEGARKSLGKKEREQSRELQERWKEAVDVIRSSHLKKYGNPLYALPWYMVIGESGSGKTTAIKSARLSSPFAEMSRTTGFSGTRNCDWWFFERAIILDTAGRYAIPVDEGRDKEEWRKFLSLLVRFRKKESLNGLVATIGADKLLGSGQEALEEVGRDIRRRIDELMRALGTKFPVYVLVTKCDLIQGMTRFCDQFSEKILDQAMGSVNHDLSRDIATFYDRSFNTIGERLRDLRLLLLHRTGAGAGREIDPGLLLFPEEFEKIRPGLRAFVQGAFRENPYQESPILRGIFYSSGRQEGSPFSHFLKSLDLIEARDVLPGSNKGLFLSDLFSRILPRDRRLFAPTQHAIEWRRQTRRFGLAAWVAAAVLIFGVLVFSYDYQKEILEDIKNKVPPPKGEFSQKEPLKDSNSMNRLRKKIQAIENGGLAWLFPILGSEKRGKVENDLKRYYCNSFKKRFLDPCLEKVKEAAGDGSPPTSDEDVANYIEHLSRQINLTRDNIGREKLLALKEVDWAAVSCRALSDPKRVDDESKKMHLSFLAWEEGETRKGRIRKLQATLESILVKNQNVVNWLKTRAKDLPDADATLEDFWKGEPSPPDDVKVSGAFTMEGKKKIGPFIKEIENALDGSPLLQEQKRRFQEYPREYAKQWRAFSLGFQNGKNTLIGREKWEDMASKTFERKGAFFEFINRMANELDALEGEELKGKAPGGEAPGREAPGGEAPGGEAPGGEALETKEPEEEVDLHAWITCVDSLSKEIEKQKDNNYEKYMQELIGMDPAAKHTADARENAYIMVKQVFASKDSPFFRAKNAEKDLMQSLNKGCSEDKSFEKLVNGPRLFLQDYITRQAACRLQELWEENVKRERDSKKQRESAFRFMEKSVNPLLRSDNKAREELGIHLPLNDAALEFSNSIQKAENDSSVAADKLEKLYKEVFKVKIKARDLNIDDGGRGGDRPAGASLQLLCSDGSDKKLNYEHIDEPPVVFAWSLAHPCDVVLEIEFPDMVLKKEYKVGKKYPQPLYDFIKDYKKRDGKFPADAFSGDHVEEMKARGIKHIEVKYEIVGGKRLRNAIGRERTWKGKKAGSKKSVPDAIYSCTYP